MGVCGCAGRMCVALCVVCCVDEQLCVCWLAVLLVGCAASSNVVAVVVVVRWQSSRGTWWWRQ